MALLGTISARQAREAVVAKKLHRFGRQHLAQAPDAVESPEIKDPKPNKKVKKALPTATKPMTQAEADEKANEERRTIWGPHVPYSNQLSNGDRDDDKEVEDEDDPRDLIVDDNGFVNQHQVDKESVKEWGRAGFAK
jgi:hypothetical protein